MNQVVDRYRKALVDRILRGPGSAGFDWRQAAFENHGVDPRARSLVDKTARCAWLTSDEDVEAVKRDGLSEDQIFELVVCAAVGQATRQLDAALAAVDAAAQTSRDVS